jgi:hypothetical protein
MKKLIVILSITINLLGCVPKEQKEASAKVAGMWGAQNISVGDSKSANTESGTKKQLTLTMGDLKDTPKDYPGENITSTSALVFINHLPKEEYKDYDEIKIIVKQNSSDFQKSYKISDILDATESFKTIDKFSKEIKTNKFSEFESLFETIPDSTLTSIKNGLENIRKKEGEPNNGTITFFEFKHITDTREPVVVCRFKQEFKKSYLEFKLVLKTQNKKIIQLSADHFEREVEKNKDVVGD